MSSLNTVIDGKNAVLGRLASYTAKKLLNGETISIINSEKVIITGDPATIKEKYLVRRERGSAHHGPYYPKTPNLIVRRTIRSMLPYKTNRGRSAFKRLRVHIGTPQDVGKAEKMEASIKTSYITIGNVAKAIGWQG